MIDLDEANRQVNPSDAVALVHLAEAYAETGDPADARSMLDSLSTLSRKDPDILFSMAMTYEYLDERGLALSHLEEALTNGLTRSKIDAAAWLDDVPTDTGYL